MDCLNTCLDVLREAKLTTRPLVLGCSGGADSTFLLYALSALHKSSPLDLLVVHVHHHLRGEEANRDAAFVETLCGELGFVFLCVDVDVGEEMQKTGEGLELCARRLRREALLSHVKEDGVLILAHTLDDQAESVLMHLMRGAGGSGAGGMAPREGELFRPLLSLRHRDLCQWLREHKKTWCEDETNHDVAYHRNWVRHEVLPLLAKNYPRVKEALASFAELRRDDEDYFEALLQEERPRLCRNILGVTLISSEARLLPSPLRRRLLLGALREFSWEGWERRHLFLLEEMLERGEGALMLPHDLLAEGTGEGLWLQRKRNSWEKPLDVGLVKTPVAVFQVKESGGEYSAWTTSWEGVAMSSCVLRPWRRGERMVLEDGREEKIAKILSDAKIPRPLRARIPVLSHGDDVLWVVGVRRGGRYQVNQRKQAWEVSCERFF